MEPQLFYKGMLENGQTRYGRDGWKLPEGKRPGVWMPKVQPVSCKSGYHVCTIDQLRTWIAPTIYLVEVRGISVQDTDKSAWEQARLIRKIKGWGIAEMMQWLKSCIAHATNPPDTVAYFGAAAIASAANASASPADTTYLVTNTVIHAAVTLTEKQWQTDLLKSMLGLDAAQQ